MAAIQAEGQGATPCEAESSVAQQGGGFSLRIVNVWRPTRAQILCSRNPGGRELDDPASSCQILSRALVLDVQVTVPWVRWLACYWSVKQPKPVIGLKKGVLDLPNSATRVL